MNTNSTSPIQNRIDSLDILRGFALLGILIMNIVSFSMISANYSNPIAKGPIEGFNKLAFIFGELFANQKFISLFSILFGASILLISKKAEERGESAAKRHYIRNFWLLILGLIHAYGLWYGDILVSYAFCSVWLFLFRHLSTKRLFLLSGLFFLISVSITYLLGISLPYWPEACLHDLRASWQPSVEVIYAEEKAYLGSWVAQLPHRIKTARELQSDVFIIGSAWYITSLMLLGMALFKSKIITAEKPVIFYKMMSLLGLPTGLIISIVGLIKNFEKGWAYHYSLFQGGLYNLLGSILMALGYIGLVMLISKGKHLPLLKKWIAPVGQMALSNYFLQSIIASFLFYGYGLALFGKVNRISLWLFILVIWTIQILYSKWWMNHFKYGPFEWLWRSLSYGHIQTIKKNNF